MPKRYLITCLSAVALLGCGIADDAWAGESRLTVDRFQRVIDDIGASMTTPPTDANTIEPRVLPFTASSGSAQGAGGGGSGLECIPADDGPELTGYFKHRAHGVTCYLTYGAAANASTGLCSTLDESPFRANSIGAICQTDDVPPDFTHYRPLCGDMISGETCYDAASYAGPEAQHVACWSISAASPTRKAFYNIGASLCTNGIGNQVLYYPYCGDIVGIPGETWSGACYVDTDYTDLQIFSIPFPCSTATVSWGSGCSGVAEAIGDGFGTETEGIRRVFGITSDGYDQGAADFQCQQGQWVYLGGGSCDPCTAITDVALGTATDGICGYVHYDALFIGYYYGGPFFVSKADDGISQWGCYGLGKEVGVPSTSDGASNTTAILAYHLDNNNFIDNIHGLPRSFYNLPDFLTYLNIGCAEDDGEVAAKLCADKGEGWYLPAIQELATIGPAVNDLFGAGSGKDMRDKRYWSSTESGDRWADTRGWEPSLWGGRSKYSKNSVRCFRK